MVSRSADGSQLAVFPVVFLKTKAYDNSRFSSLGIAMLLQHLRHRHENTGRKCHVKKMIAFFLAMSNLFESLVKGLEGLIPALVPRNVTASVAELLELLCKPGALQFDGLSDNVDEIFVTHLIRGETYDLDIVWKCTSFLLRIY